MIGEYITYKQIADITNKMKLTPIKGKDYANVNERVKAFRMLFPQGRIETELVKFEDGICIVKAMVKDETGNILATGLSYEREGSSMINKTSFLENCETSAVGRALGFIGFGIDAGMASADEMEIALEKQEQMQNAGKDDDKLGEVRVCAKCNNLILPAKKADGSGMMTAKEIAEFSFKRFGEFRCADCMKKAKK